MEEQLHRNGKGRDEGTEETRYHDDSDLAGLEIEDDPSPDEDDDEDDEEDIYESVTACLGLFSCFTGQAGLSNTSDDLQRFIEPIEDVNRSFNIWIDYTGALAADVSRSLDARLHGYKDIKSMAVELLQMLARNLEYCMFQTKAILLP